MDDFDPRTSAEIINPKINLTPKTILTLAHKDPDVAHYVIRWEKGELTWEQTLIAIILSLAERNNKLIQILLITSPPGGYPINNPDYNITDTDNRCNEDPAKKDQKKDQPGWV